MNKKYIKFSNEWFHGSHYIKRSGSHHAFAIYGLLQYIEPYNGNVMTSIDGIRELLDIDKNTRDNTRHIKEALTFLADNKMIEFYKDAYMKESIECNLETLKGKSYLFIKLINRRQERMTLIKYSEYEAILENKELSPTQKMAMMCYFGAIISHINHKEKVSYAKYEVLMEESQIGSKTTCINFNRKMVKMGILLYMHDRVNEKPPQGRVPLAYARTEDKVYLEIDRQVE